MATKINCRKCEEDTGYTDETAVASKTRSLKYSSDDENLRLHFCTACWEKLVVSNM